MRNDKYSGWSFILLWVGLIGFSFVFYAGVACIIGKVFQ